MTTTRIYGVSDLIERRNDSMMLAVYLFISLFICIICVIQSTSLRVVIRLTAILFHSRMYRQSSNNDVIKNEVDENQCGIRSNRTFDQIVRHIPHIPHAQQQHPPSSSGHQPRDYHYSGVYILYIYIVLPTIKQQ